MATIKTPMGPKKLGQFLRAQRENVSIGYREASRSIGVSDTYLGAIEHGYHETPPSEEVLRAMARLYKADLDVILCAAGRVPESVERWIVSDVRRMRALRRRAGAKSRKKPTEKTP